ncbi:hypothetical protein Ciccas_008159 [Cichlidogyrus casuarinus]|uniref:Uncharacterized protein n=1 Tax=Cichlidogyrus casuarinus TaxID=1844966 RepID=A0ABD2Q3D5_9PLAT
MSQSNGGKKALGQMAAEFIEENDAFTQQFRTFLDEKFEASGLKKELQLSLLDHLRFNADRLPMLANKDTV